MQRIKFQPGLPKDWADYFVLAVIVGVAIFAVLFINHTLKTHERYDVDESMRTVATEVAGHYQDLAANSLRERKVLADEKFDHTKTLEGVAPIPEGTTVFIKSAKTPGKVCVYVINPNGLMSAKDAGIARGNAPACSNTKKPELNVKPQDVVDAVKDF